MAEQTLTAADAVLKDDYKGPLRDQLNNANVLLAQLDRNDEDVQGRRAVMAIHIGRNKGIGARGELETLPTAGRQRYEEVDVPLRYNYGRLALSGPVIRAMRSDRGSFVRALKSETNGLLTDIKRDVNRQMWGTSDGVIAATGVTTASTTVVLAATTTATQLRQLEDDMVIDIGTVATPDAVAADREILSVDYTAKTITISGAAVTTAATDRIFRAGAGGASNGSGRPNDGQRELTGMQHIVDDDSVLFGIDPATEPKWASVVDDNGGTARNVSENLLAKVQNQAEIASGKAATLIITSPGVHRAYANLLTTLKRFVNTTNLKGGYSGITAGAATGGVGGGTTTATFAWERDAPEGTMFGIALDEMVQFEMSDWEWMDEDGAVLSRIPEKDGYEATLFKYHEVATYRRNAHFRIDNINEAA